MVRQRIRITFGRFEYSMNMYVSKCCHFKDTGLVALSFPVLVSSDTYASVLQLTISNKAEIYKQVYNSGGSSSRCMNNIVANSVSVLVM